mmetsp:Transcript_3691/g.4964  ORF Transcript_3691/g.4964 Transcript_3691/m.4964 type:complete len:942 (+) Transcript_3691:207-3032(+)
MASFCSTPCQSRSMPETMFSSSLTGKLSKKTIHQTRKKRENTRQNCKFNVVAKDDNFGGMGAVANVATQAAMEVSKAVGSKGIEAPDGDGSFVALDQERRGQVDEEGLPVVYDKELIQAYWTQQGGALQQRWTEFLGYSVPFLTKIVTMLITGGMEEVQRNDASLARDARIIMENLGPTYIKLGQMMSVRPDVLPQAALNELANLQDSVKAFDTSVAYGMIESELGCPINEVFSEISTEPVAAASLAQVYRARLAGTGEWVAVKVQRPSVLSVVSKDLYVLRRAAEVYQGLVARFAPQQRTDYVALLNEWAVGFYTELDFLNEASNQQRLRDYIQEQGVADVYVPEVYHSLCRRRLLVSEWIDGVKLSDCPPEEVRELIKLGQECFLVQLLQVGFFHSDPHPGNLMKMSDTSKGRLALLDFGLVATVQQEDMDTMVSSIVHLANKDYSSLVNDFIKLKILPADCDRSKVVPLMDKALSPYVKGGGAKTYEAELKKIYKFDEGAVGGFQAMTQDMLTVMNDIPFSIPPYFALLARAVVTLEGIALGANPDYRLVMEAYPFVARKLLREDRPEIQVALQQVLYSGGGEAGQLTPARLAVLLNSAQGILAKNDASVFVDFDSVPEDGISVQETIRYLLSPQAISLRGILEAEVSSAADILLRQGARKLYNRVVEAIPTPPFNLPRPQPQNLPAPFIIPTGDPIQGAPLVPVITSLQNVVDLLAPALSREDEIYALSLADLAQGLGGEDLATAVRGDIFMEPETFTRLALEVLASGQAPGALSSSTLTQAATQLKAQFFQGASESKESQLQEVIDTLESLDVDEKAELARLQDRLVASLWYKCASRMSPLLPEGVKIMSPPAHSSSSSLTSTSTHLSASPPKLTVATSNSNPITVIDVPVSREELFVPNASVDIILPQVEIAPNLEDIVLTELSIPALLRESNNF